MGRVWHRGRLRLAVLVLVLTTLFVTAVAAVRGRLPAITQDPPPPRTPVLPSSSPSLGVGDEPDWNSIPPQPPSQGGQLSVLTTILWWLGWSLVVALAVYIVVRVVGARQRRLPEPEVAPIEDDVLTAYAPVALVQAHETLSSTVDVRDAITTAWRTLESLVMTTGIVREPSQTTHEYVTGVLARLPLDDAALDEFADLYLLALFGDVPPDEDDRTRALELLDRMRADLANGRHHA